MEEVREGREGFISRVSSIDYEDNFNPIIGLDNNNPLPTFDDAIASACQSPDLPQEVLQTHSKRATLHAKKNSETDPLLTFHQMAALHLYTQESPFYIALNENLRSRDRAGLAPFFPILRLLLSALYALPQQSLTVYRGVKKDLWQHFNEGDQKIGWALTSTTEHIGVLQSDHFLGLEGRRTLFMIDTKNAVDVSDYSAFRSEREFILPPGSRFVVVSRLKISGDCFMIQMKQEPYLFLLKNFKLPLTADVPVTSSEVAISSGLVFHKSAGIVKTKYNFIQAVGSFGSGDGQFNQPRSVAMDANGNIVVVDKDNHRIQVFGADGKFIRQFGSKGCGDGQFDLPIGVAVDANGLMAVVEYGNHRIQVFGEDGKFIRKFGKYGSRNGEFARPRAVAIDTNGNFVVVDCGNHRIQVFGADGKFLWKFGSKGCGAGKFRQPRSVAIDTNGRIFVADYLNKRIQVFEANGEFVLKFGVFGSDDGFFKHPICVIVDADRNIIVVDQNNYRIQVFNADGKFLLKLGSEGSDDGQFNGPSGVAIDANGNIVVADTKNNRIQVFG